MDPVKISRSVEPERLFYFLSKMNLVPSDSGWLVVYLSLYNFVEMNLLLNLILQKLC